MPETPTRATSRWREFWPRVDEPDDATRAIELSSWIVFAGAAFQFVLALVLGLGAGGAGLAVNGAVYTLCGLGVRRGWRAAAVVGLLLHVSDMAIRLMVNGRGPGIPGLVVLLGFISAVRATYALRRFNRSHPHVTDTPAGTA